MRISFTLFSRAKFLFQPAETSGFQANYARYLLTIGWQNQILKKQPANNLFI